MIVSVVPGPHPMISVQWLNAAERDEFMRQCNERDHGIATADSGWFGPDAKGTKGL